MSPTADTSGKGTDQVAGKLPDTAPAVSKRVSRELQGLQLFSYDKCVGSWSCAFHVSQFLMSGSRQHSHLASDHVP